MLRFWIASVLISAGAYAAAAPRQIVFDGPSAEQKWTLKELAPALPADWTGYEFLVMELKASSPQRFEFKIYTANGVRSQRLHPFPGAWIRATVPLKYFRRPDREGFDMASMGNKPRASFWINLSGSTGTLDAVQALGFAMQSPVGKPTLEIRSVTLSKTDPGSAVLEPKPVVDEFGQWIPENRDRRSLDQLKKEWAAEEASLRAGEFDYCRYGGYRASKAKATGFFRVEQIDGKWWFVDPDGHLFFSAGADVMSPWMGTPVNGREDVFAALPPADLTPAGRPGNRASQASFHTWNLQRRFGADWAKKWVDLTVRRMNAWGLNTVGNWSDPRLGASGRIPYVSTLRGWGIETAPLGLVDVYSPDWARQVDEAAARQCAPRKADPWLLGYFVANEPPWPGKESLAVDTILEGPATPMQRELKAFLAQGDTPARRKEFVLRAFEKSLEVINAAIRKHDPNHLNLGIRFGGKPPDEVVRAARVFDVYSQNVYDFVPDAKMLEKVYSLTGRPILIGEFHIGTPVRGLAPGLVQVSDLEERGVAYRYYVENAAAMPAFIGAHWFQWVDEPATGRSDGENYNIGFVDGTDRPYHEMVEAMQATHKRLLAVHSGKEAPVSRKAKVQ